MLLCCRPENHTLQQVYYPYFPSRISTIIITNVVAMHYRKAIKADPFNADCWGNYALFLESVRNKFKLAGFFFKALWVNGWICLYAERIYLKAVEVNPHNPNVLCNYGKLLICNKQSHEFAAVFLKNIRNDNDLAERMYQVHCILLIFPNQYCQNAIESDPMHVNSIGNYALFLKTVRNDLNGAGWFLLCR